MKKKISVSLSLFVHKLILLDFDDYNVYFLSNGYKSVCIKIPKEYKTYKKEQDWNIHGTKYKYKH